MTVTGTARSTSPRTAAERSVELSWYSDTQMTPTLRYRSIQLRASSEQEGVLTGYATIYDTAYQIAPGLTETICRGAFDTSLREVDGIVPVFWNHGWAKTNAAPIGWARLRGDENGVHIDECHLFLNSEEGLRVWEAAKATAIREWSLGFKGDRIRRRGKDEGIEAGTIIELSVVIKGAALTTMSVRSEDDLVSLREFELAEGAEIIDENENEEPPAHAGDGTEETEGSQPEGEGAESTEDPVLEQAYGLLAHKGVRDALSVMEQTNTQE